MPNSASNCCTSLIISGVISRDTRAACVADSTRFLLILWSELILWLILDDIDNIDNIDDVDDFDGIDDTDDIDDNYGGRKYKTYSKTNWYTSNG